MSGLPVPRWVSILERAEKWSSPPWIITGENLTRWRRLVWEYRYELYSKEFSDKIQREKRR